MNKSNIIKVRLKFNLKLFKKEKRSHLYDRVYKNNKKKKYIFKEKVISLIRAMFIIINKKKK